jgi:hypothetical protein
MASLLSRNLIPKTLTPASAYAPPVISATTRSATG